MSFPTHGPSVGRGWFFFFSLSFFSLSLFDLCGFSTNPLNPPPPPTTTTSTTTTATLAVPTQTMGASLSSPVSVWLLDGISNTPPLVWLLLLIPWLLVFRSWLREAERCAPLRTPVRASASSVLV